MDRVWVGVILFAFLGMPGVVRSSCGSPEGPGLWESVEQAQLIVVARVHSVRRDEPNQVSTLYSQTRRLSMDAAETATQGLSRAVDSFLPDLSSHQTFEARLQVMETLKGPHRDQIRTTYGQTCIENGFFVPGEPVIAFLRWDLARWQTLPWYESLAYAPGRQQLEALSQLLRDAVALQQQVATPADARHRWSRRAVALPAARPYALREAESLPLNDLAKIFVDRPYADHSALVILKRLQNHPDPTVDETAVAVLEAWLAHDSTAIRMGPRGLSLVAKRFGTGYRRKPPRRRPSDEAVRLAWQSARDLFEEAGVSVPVVDPTPLAHEVAYWHAWQQRLIDVYEKAHSPP